MPGDQADARCRAIWARPAASRSVEGAQAAVREARYPQVPGAPDFEPEGERGWASSLAPSYWGLAPQDYCEAADVWPLDPDGELLLRGIVENVRGMNALPDILR
jgi:4-hydroxy-2-oxoheptanedioate aldolase